MSRRLTAHEKIERALETHTPSQLLRAALDVWIAHPTSEDPPETVDQMWADMRLAIGHEVENSFSRALSGAVTYPAPFWQRVTTTIAEIEARAQAQAGLAPTRGEPVDLDAALRRALGIDPTRDEG